VTSGSLTDPKAFFNKLVNDNHNIKLIAIDIDGTLLTKRGQITRASRLAIAEARKQGLHVAVATGRRFRTTKAILDELSIEFPAIVHEGALVKDCRTARTLFCNYIPKDICQDLLDFLRERDQAPVLYVDCYRKGLDFLVQEGLRGNAYYQSYLKRYRAFCQMAERLENCLALGVVEMCVFGEVDPLLSLAAEVREAFDPRIVARMVSYQACDQPGACLEILRKGTSKWTGLSRVARKMGIRDEEILAIGDEINDLEMIENAGIGVAMGNSHKAVKEAADFVTEDTEHEGLAVALHRFLFAAR